MFNFNNYDIYDVLTAHLEVQPGEVDPGPPPPTVVPAVEVVVVPGVAHPLVLVAPVLVDHLQVEVTDLQRKEKLREKHQSMLFT